MRYLAFCIDPPIAGDLFDVASMQFALHYMGQTEGRMRRFLHEVSRHLRVGGIFIATTMDSRVLMQLLMGHAEQSWVSEMVTRISVFSVRYLHIVGCVRLFIGAQPRACGYSRHPCPTTGGDQRFSAWL